MNPIIKNTIFLAIIACLSGLSIGVVNGITEPIIKERAIASEKKNLEIIFPDSEFEALQYTDEEGTIIGAYVAKDKGFIFKATAKGYNSSNPIITLVGLDNDGTVVNVIALEQQETSGLGSRCFEETNIQKLYVGKKVGEEADAISGATLTSNAMKLMISKAQEAYEELK